MDDGIRRTRTTKEYHKFDETTLAVKTIDYPHHEIHDGNGYVINEAYDLPINNVIDVRITTASTDIYSHFLLNFDTESQYEWWFYEDATIVGTTSPYIPLNQNRNSDNTSGNTVSIITNATLALATSDTNTASATTLMHGYSGSGKQEGGTDGTREEWILKSNTTYCFRAEAVAAGYIHGNMTWYEHRNNRKR